MKNQYEGDLTNFVLQASRLSIIWCFLSQGLPFILIVISAMPSAIKVISIILLVSASKGLFHLLPRQIMWQYSQLRFTSDYGWQIKNVRDGFDSVEILPSTWICSWLIVLHFQFDERRYTWPIFCDAMPADEFRRLRVYLQTVGVIG